MRENNPLTHLRIAGAMAAALLAVELVGFVVFDVHYRFYDLAWAFVLAAAVVILYSLVAWPVFRALKLKRETACRATSLAGSLALVGLVLLMWVRLRYVGRASLPWEILAAGVLLALLAGLGAMLWSYLSRGDPHLGNIRFRALAPVAVVSVGTYSVAGHALSQPHYRAMAVLGIFVFFLAAYYLLIRGMWRGRRKFLERWGRVIHVGLIIAVALATAAGAGLSYYKNSRPAAAPPGSPPVFLISIDTLRSDQLSSYDKEAPKTPAMDSLARDGIRFEHAVAPSSWTPPSVASFLTGLSPTACGAGLLIPGNPHNYTGPLLSSRTIAEVFQKAGYHTTALVYNRWLDESREFDQGFEHYEMLKGKKQKPRFLASRVYDLLRRAAGKPWEGTAEHQTARTIELLENRAPGPFFFWVHYLDPHLPYYKHEKYKPAVSAGPMTKYLAKDKGSVNIRAEIFGLREPDRKYLLQRYQGEVRFTDDQVEKLLDWIKDNNLYKDSLIILTSDHGEEFWEHDSFAHAHTFHKEIVEVPLIIKLPGNRHAGRTVKHWTDLKRMGATMMDVAGVSGEFPGESLLKDVNGNPPLPIKPEDRFWISEKVLYGLEKGAIVDRHGHKAMFHQDGSITCYDLKSDPLEQNPLTIEECPWPEDTPSPREVFDSIRKRDKKKWKELGGEDADRGEIPQDNLKKLKALGYF